MQLPDSLWDGERLLLPPALVKAYLESLERAGLTELAMGPRPKQAPVGGLSKEQTDNHYVHAFDGSVARVQLAVLDPNSEVSEASRTLQRFVSGGGVCLVDVPCGAGAGALSLLCTVAELRAKGVLPRLPLNVYLIGGEISEPAIAYAKELTASLRLSLAAQAIFVEAEFRSWDVLSQESNSQLVERIILNKARYPQALLLICNFNGFLERGGKKDAAKRQLDELFRYASGPANGAVWIEPDMNAARDRLFPWLASQLKKIAWFARPSEKPDAKNTSSAKFAVPIRPHTTVNVRLCVMPIDLTRGEDSSA